MVIIWKMENFGFLHIKKYTFKFGKIRFENLVDKKEKKNIYKKLSKNALESNEQISKKEKTIKK